MASATLFRTVTSKSIKSPLNYIIFRNFSNELHGSSMQVKEVQIPTDWGHIAGKLWGSDQQRPILALHGWQDNANTWDTLVPLLPKDISILAVDFPGHGLSSWYPKGMHYHVWDWPRSIQIIKDFYNWDKVSFLAHSMGCIAAVRYSMLFPQVVDLLIGFENLVTEIFPASNLLLSLPERLKKVELENKRLHKEPPSYNYEEALKILHLGTGKSVALETAHHLLKRGTKPSKFDSNKLYFCRDSRLKHVMFVPEDRDFIKTFAENMKYPILYFKASNSNYATDDFSVEMRNFILKNNNKAECHFVPGTHHVHLNDPKSVAPTIIPFINKHFIQTDAELKKIRSVL